MGLNDNIGEMNIIEGTEFPQPLELKEPEVNPKDFQSDPAGSASMLFGLYYPKFSQALETLPAKALRRLLRALIGVPLVDASPNLKRPEERVAYSVAERLLEAKTVIALHNLFEHQKELQTLDASEESAPAQPT